MNNFARILTALAVAGHIGLIATDGFAKPGGSAAAAGHGSPAAGHGVATANGVGFGVNGVVGGHIGVDGQNSGHEGVQGKGDPSSPAGGAPPFFGDFTGFSASASASGACGAPLDLPDTSWYSDPVNGVELLSQQTQNYIAFCGCNTQSCVAGALDKYADALEQALTPPSPPPGLAPLPPRPTERALRDLPRIVREAAKQVRAAKTPHSAQKALQAAIAIVQKTVTKTIPLMRAVDPDAKKAATRGAGLVADTLEAARVALMRADTL